MRYVMFDAELP